MCDRKSKRKRVRDREVDRKRQRERVRGEIVAGWLEIVSFIH